MNEERKERFKREDIALKVVKGFLKKDCDENTELYYSLQTILEKYNEEKEKNKSIEAQRLRDMCYKTDGNYISKDKIKEKIEELEKTREMLTDSNGMIEISASIDILKELLEGE